MSSEQTKARILIADDDPTLNTAMVRYLEKVGYEVASAANGNEASRLLESEKFTAAIFDVKMPGISGGELVPIALKADPDLAILMLSGMNDAKIAASCLQQGALDYLLKPIDMGDLAMHLVRVIRRRDANVQKRDMSDWMREELHLRTEELERERQKLEAMSVATLEALIAALEAKDPFQIGHSARVADLAASVAVEMELEDDEVERIRLAARLHDLGKIGVREAVLNKSGPLSDEEYEHVQEHVHIGAQILKPMAHLGPIVDYVKYHHEHWDGSGYPSGLSRDTIPIGARVIGAAEVYDSLTSDRPYAEKLTPREAAERMKSLGGHVLDPKVVEALAKAVTRRRTLTFVGDED